MNAFPVRVVPTAASRPATVPPPPSAEAPTADAYPPGASDARGPTAPDPPAAARSEVALALTRAGRQIRHVSVLPPTGDTAAIDALAFVTDDVADGRAVVAQHVDAVLETHPGWIRTAPPD